MWGLNLGTGTKEEAATEAAAVDAALGDRLHSFEIGNEVDYLPRFARNYDAYHAAYAEYTNGDPRRVAARGVFPVPTRPGTRRGANVSPPTRGQICAG